jgi:acyl-CoA thioester hydrolase
MNQIKNQAELTAEIEKTINFYDVDSMDIVWHGNYVKYLEDARCALLDIINYDYTKMRDSGYAWPVVSLNIKYIRPCRFRQKIKIKATLTEYENCLKIKYLITDKETGEKLSKAETMQMAVNMQNFESCFECPMIFTQKVRKYLGKI